MACVMSFFMPQVSTNGTHGVSFLSRELITSVVPVLAYNEEDITKKEQLAAGAEYENRRALGQSGLESGQMQSGQPQGGITDLPGQTGASSNVEQPENGQNGQQGNEKQDGTGQNHTAAPDDTEQNNTPQGMEQNDAAEGTEQDGAAKDADSDGTKAGTEESTATFQILWPQNVSESGNRADTKPTDAKLLEKLNDFDYLIQNYYIVDSSTTIRSSDISAAELLAKDLTIAEDVDGPQILIYHTHSQETYGGAPEGDDENSVVAVGEYLTRLLTEQYGFSVLHHTGEYDVNDRDHAYSNAAPALKEILEENPTIEVVIDLHRDSVPEKNHLVTQINGKDCAKIMFFNGLCRTTARGDLTKMPNPYLQDNLAFSLQMQLAAADQYPDFTRRIYLKGYRYNMHFCPKTLLVEVGAQNNSLEEAMNAMEPLASLLSKVLQN